MSYAPLSDGFHSHPKVIALGRDQAAITLWTLALSYVTQHLSDGFVPHSVTRRLCHRRATVWSRSLVRVGLWEEVEGGYRFHDYLQWQRSRQEIEDLRNKRRIAGSLGGSSKAIASAKHDAKQLAKHVLGDRSTHVSSRLVSTRHDTVTEGTAAVDNVDNSPVGHPTNPEDVAHATGPDSNGSEAAETVTSPTQGEQILSRAFGLLIRGGRYEDYLAATKLAHPEYSDLDAERAALRAVQQSKRP